MHVRSDGLSLRPRGMNPVLQLCFQRIQIRSGGQVRQDRANFRHRRLDDAEHVATGTSTTFKVLALVNARMTSQAWYN